MTNNFLLIESIKVRRPLWDKRLWDSCDAIMREELWKEVANLLGVPRDAVKTRWKNLRDSYRKLLIKAADSPDPKWRYFKALEFIKDIILNTKPKVNDIFVKGAEMVSIKTDYAVTVDSYEEITEDPLSFTTDTNTTMSISSASLDAEAGRKRKATEDTTSFLEIDLPKSSEPYEKTTINYPNDEDLQFLLSLYPHFKEVPLYKKLPLRMKIEKVIYEELCAAENSTDKNCSYDA